MEPFPESVSNEGPQGGHDPEHHNPKPGRKKRGALGKRGGCLSPDPDHDGSPSDELKNVHQGRYIRPPITKRWPGAHHGWDTPLTPDKASEGQGGVPDKVA